jgi:hypothetical protein
VDLKERLIQIPPRDVSGPRSSDRFVYQQTWALCRLLLLHKNGAEYVIVLDHHEDVMVLDSEHAPKSIAGFQIKTAPSNWTIKSLLKREKGEGESASLLPSILGRLYDLKSRFGAEVNLLQFVSNKPVSVRLKSDGKKHYNEQLVQFNNLDQTDADLITESLKTEAALQELPVLSNLLEFAVTEIPLREHAIHGTGVLAEFLSDLFPKKEFTVVPIFKTLLSEIARRNNSQKDITSFDDLLKYKSISRAVFSKILITVGASEKRISWDEVSARLNSENVPLSFWRELWSEWESAVLDRLTRRDLAYTHFLRLVEDACRDAGKIEALGIGIESIYQQLQPNLRKEWGFSEGYVKSAIALELYEPSEHKDVSSYTAEEGSK